MTSLTERGSDIPAAHAALTLRILRARRENQQVVGVTVDELDAWCRTIATLLKDNAALQAVADTYFEMTDQIAKDEANRQAKKHADFFAWVMKA